MFDNPCYECHVCHERIWEKDDRDSYAWQCTNCFGYCNGTMWTAVCIPCSHNKLESLFCYCGAKIVFRGKVRHVPEPVSF